jgi:tRNA A-37 threonylcarbamoyl transferase component Bud32/Flp pilus assembly protein TadD
MWIATANLPANLASELAEGRFVAIAEIPGDDAVVAFARGIAFSNLGRIVEAREALRKASAEPKLSDAALVEIGFLDLNTPNGLVGVAARTKVFLETAAGATLLVARARHLLGVAQFRLMRAGDALDALTCAQKTYRDCDSESGEAQVLDTLGMVHQWLGNETAALVCYSHSLALKTQLGDYHGSAVTLGNLGRYCAMLGRPTEAVGFLSLDLKIANELSDARGQARVLSDLAEIARDQNNFCDAKLKLERALTISRANGLTQLEFEIQLSLATTALVAGAAADAAIHLEHARRIAGDAAEGFDKLLIDWTESKLISGSNVQRAIALMGEAVAGFRDHDIPSLEIEARLALSELLMTAGKQLQAERETLVALKRARERSLPRYRTRIFELMERMSLAEGVAEESGKSIDDKPSGAVDGYLLRERLGGGAFATVYRAFDVERAREVALKVLDLESRYSKTERDRILDSARLDIEAANRARHPGLVKVFAIGRDARGNSYLAVEYIAGSSMRERLDGKPARDVKLACSTLADIAEALGALHAQGVVHRDLKPENIMLRVDGSPVIVDFGIAHVLGVESTNGAVSRGTRGYFSPQQGQGKAPMPSDDMFSFGVIVWEWLSGARPDDSSRPTRKASIFGNHGEPRSAEELAAALTDSNPALRPTAPEAAALLRGFAA